MKKFLIVLMVCVLSLSLSFEALGWNRDGVLVAAVRTKKKIPAKKKSTKKQSEPVMKLSKKQYDEFFEICQADSLEKFAAKLERENISPNAKYYDREGWDSNLLMLAASMTSNAKIIKFLLSRGADVNARDNYGFSPLTNAIINPTAGDSNIEEFIQILLRAGANINAKDHLGRTPLMFALDEDHYGFLLSSTRVINLLLNAGADVNARDKKNKRAVDYARKRKELRGTDVLRRLEEASR